MNGPFLLDRPSANKAPSKAHVGHACQEGVANALNSKTGWRGASATKAARSDCGVTSKEERTMEKRVTYSLRIGALSCGASSRTASLSCKRPRVRVTIPAARTLRTQLTAPLGDTSQRLPLRSMGASRRVWLFPLVRPTTVNRENGPTATPTALSDLTNALKRRCHKGVRYFLPIAVSSCFT